MCGYDEIILTSLYVCMAKKYNLYKYTKYEARQVVMTNRRPSLKRGDRLSKK